jgi:hypothetical protein
MSTNSTVARRSAGSLYLAPGVMSDQPIPELSDTLFFDNPLDVVRADRRGAACRDLRAGDVRSLLRIARPPERSDAPG